MGNGKHSPSWEKAAAGWSRERGGGQERGLQSGHLTMEQEREENEITMLV